MCALREKLLLLNGRILRIYTVGRDTQETTACADGGMNSA